MIVKTSAAVLSLSILLAAAAAPVASRAESAGVAEGAGVGARSPSERSTFIDDVTGASVTRLTNSPAQDNKIYQTHPNWTSDGAYLIFDSDRAGRGETFAMEEATGEIIQLTDKDGGALVVSRGRPVMFLVRGGAVIEVDLKRLLADSRAGAMKPASSYRRTVGKLPEGASLSGTYTEDADGRTLYFGLALKDGSFALDQMSVANGEVAQIMAVPFKIGHCQAHPARPGIISYCQETGGDAEQRMWIVNADGSDNRPFYKETYNEWVTHETWWTDDRMLFAIWPDNDEMLKKPHGIASVSMADGSHKIHDQFPYWHVCGTADGKWAVGDTHEGEIYAVEIATGTRRLLTQGHRPEGAKSHPHQSIAPDGKRVLFVSSKFGNWDLVTVELPTL